MRDKRRIVAGTRPPCWKTTFLAKTVPLTDMPEIASDFRHICREAFLRWPTGSLPQKGPAGSEEVSCPFQLKFRGFNRLDHPVAPGVEFGVGNLALGVREHVVLFDEEAAKLTGIRFLGQGTIYPDILESEKGIKAHHNVGGLPAEMEMELVEPVKLLYKDEVRVVGRALGLPESMVDRQPFPGPGLAVRTPGAITRDRLEAVRESDAILREEFAKNGLQGKVWQYFTIVPDFKSTGIKDGKRTFDWFVVIRAVNTTDAIEASIEEIPYDLLRHITKRITTEVKGVNRVLYDLTPKPSGTIEWE